MWVHTIEYKNTFISFFLSFYGDGGGGQRLTEVDRGQSENPVLRLTSSWTHFICGIWIIRYKKLVCCSHVISGKESLSFSGYEVIHISHQNRMLRLCSIGALVTIMMHCVCYQIVRFKHFFILACIIYEV